MTTHVRKSESEYEYTALNWMQWYINKKSCISDWCKKQFAGWFGTLPLFPNLRFHFQKCSREIFMEHTHTRTLAHSHTCAFILLLSQTNSSQVSQMPVVRTFFLCYFITNIKSCSTVTKNDIYTNIATGMGFYVTLTRARSHTMKIKEIWTKNNNEINFTKLAVINSPIHLQFYFELPVKSVVKSLHFALRNCARHLNSMKRRFWRRKKKYSSVAAAATVHLRID